jgi:hypothetical protein
VQQRGRKKEGGSNGVAGARKGRIGAEPGGGEEWRKEGGEKVF